MPVFKGNTSTSALSGAYENALDIVSLKVENKSAGTVTINISILYGSTNVLLTPYNLSLTVGQGWEDDDIINLLPGYQIYVLVTGNCDYYFSLKDSNG